MVGHVSAHMRGVWTKHHRLPTLFRQIASRDEDGQDEAERVGSAADSEHHLGAMGTTCGDDDGGWRQSLGGGHLTMLCPTAGYLIRS